MSESVSLQTEVAILWRQAMLRGDFAAAWRQTDRLELPRRQGEISHQPGHLLWDGTPFERAHVVVRCLHGLGDTLQYLRFLPGIVARAKRVDFLVQPQLLRLLGAYGNYFGNLGNIWEDYRMRGEVEIEVMELAYALRADAAMVSSYGAYLDPEPILRSALPLRMAFGRGLNVGLVWAASEWDPSRSIPYAELLPLLATPGVKFHSLQQGPRLLDSGDLMEVLATQSEDILEAASAMLSMDLVITVDTMAAHLAGALGRPTWLLLREEADWRWGREDTTPWYPSLRIFRQTRPGDWRSLIQAMREVLASLASGGPPS